MEPFTTLTARLVAIPKDHIEVRGFGREDSRTLKLRR